MSEPIVVYGTLPGGGLVPLLADAQGRLMISSQLAGPSAYDVAVSEGFVGDVTAWLASLQGSPGVAGPSAYDVAVSEGFVGDEAAWLATLGGIPGPSAYDVAVSEGFVGDETAWLASLQGPPGESGAGATPCWGGSAPSGFSLNTGVNSQTVRTLSTVRYNVGCTYTGGKLYLGETGFYRWSVVFGLNNINNVYGVVRLTKNAGGSELYYIGPSNTSAALSLSGSGVVQIDNVLDYLEVVYVNVLGGSRNTAEVWLDVEKLRDLP